MNDTQILIGTLVLGALLGATVATAVLGPRRAWAWIAGGAALLGAYLFGLATSRRQGAGGLAEDTEPEPPPSAKLPRYIPPASRTTPTYLEVHRDPMPDVSRDDADADALRVYRRRSGAARPRDPHTLTGDQEDDDEGDPPRVRRARDRGAAV